MAESTEESLFQDVHNVQASLESLYVVNYDVNRIYNSLERHLNNGDRVTLVVNEILDAIGAPLEDLGIPVSGYYEEDSSQGTVILDDTITIGTNSYDRDIISNPNLETVAFHSDDSTVSDDTAQQSSNVHNHRPSDNNVPTDQPKINNNYANNNTDQENLNTSFVPSREDVINMEARQVRDIVPQSSLVEIQSYLKKCEHVPNRVSVVIEICINGGTIPFDLAKIKVTAGCSYNEKAIQKNRNVKVSAIKDRAFTRIVEEINGFADQLATPTNVEVVEECSAKKKPNIIKQQEEPYYGLPLGPLPSPSTSEQSKQAVKKEGLLLTFAVEVPGLSVVKNQTVLPSAQGTAQLLPEIKTELKEPLKNSLAGADIVATHPKESIVPINIPPVAPASDNRVPVDETKNIFPSPMNLDVGLPVNPYRAAAFQQPGSSDKATMPLDVGNPAGSALFKDAQPSSSKRKMPVDQNGKVAVKETKVKLPDSKPHPPVAELPHKYLNTISEMFPTVDLDYLQNCCDELGKDDIGVVISHLLEDSQLLASHQTLTDILPDADPNYLWESWGKVGSNQEELKQFVADSLENRNYPKLVDCQKRSQMAALQKKFTEEFSIEGFLEMFPDPFKHFENLQKNGKPTHSVVEGRSFLMARYPKIVPQNIDQCYSKYQFRLLETCKELDKITSGFMQSTQTSFEIPVYKTNKNLSFLQEIAFIENEAKIRQHMKGIADNRQKMFDKAKSKGELLSCGCCYDDEFLPEDMAACNEGHIFCKECIKKGAEVEIGNGKNDLPCLIDCGNMISLQTLQGILKPSVFIRLDQRKRLEEVKAAGIEDLETCPFCDFGTIPSHDDRIFKCLNPLCMKESCRLCKEPSHIPLRCNEVENSEEVKLRTYIEDRMTEALVRTCWKCNKKFIKEDGCNKMTCTCGALMCYLCRQPVKDYSHFNGQGGDAVEKCPLYSNNDQLHVNAVREEAKKAKEEVEAKNPQMTLKHDPTLILPTAMVPAVAVRAPAAAAPAAPRVPAAAPAAR